MMPWTLLGLEQGTAVEDVVLVPLATPGCSKNGLVLALLMMVLVMAAVVAYGPEVGRILTHVEDWWIGGYFSADENACRERLKAVIAGA